MELLSTTVVSTTPVILGGLSLFRYHACIRAGLEKVSRLFTPTPINGSPRLITPTAATNQSHLGFEQHATNATPQRFDKTSYQVAQWLTSDLLFRLNAAAREADVVAAQASTSNASTLNLESARSKEYERNGRRLKKTRPALTTLLARVPIPFKSRTRMQLRRMKRSQSRHQIYRPHSRTCPAPAIRRSRAGRPTGGTGTKPCFRWRRPWGCSPM